MNTNAICILVVLTGCSVPPAVGAQTTPGAGITKGTITIPSKDLIFQGPLTSPLGPLGGFQIEVKLPQKEISASECGPDNGLAVQMGDVAPLGNDLNTPKNPALAKKNKITTTIS